MSPERQRQVAAALLILGAVAAILLPFISATLLTLALGGIAFSAGVSQLLRLGQDQASDKLFRLLSAVLYIGGALFILIDPIEGEISLTLFAGVVVLVEGIMELARGQDQKRRWPGLCCSMACSRQASACFWCSSGPVTASGLWEHSSASPCSHQP